MHGAVFKRVLLLAFVLIIFGCKKDNKTDVPALGIVPTLNLTKNALWDHPALNEVDRDSLFNKMKHDYDPRLVSFIDIMNHGDVPLKELQYVHDTLSHSKSVYAGYLRLQILNNILIQTPYEKFTKEFVKKLLKEGYTIAEGQSPIPQAVFFNFWDNCMVGLSNISDYEGVSDESQRLMEICENQNLPMGVMFAYRALAGNLQDHFDFTTAFEEYEKAAKAARECLPKLLGDDWLSPENLARNIRQSDYMACYADIISNQLYCCVNNHNYDWIRKNEKLLHLIIKGSVNQPTLQICMFSNIAQYYDAIGNDSLYQKFVDGLNVYKPDSNQGSPTFDDMMYNYNYNQTMALHELKLNNIEKALYYMNNIDRNWRMLQSDEVYAKIYIKLGRYKEATERLTNIVEHDKRNLDGRNRFTLTSMSSNIENKKRDIKMMQGELEKQQMQSYYNRVVIVLAFVLIVVLALFLYRQHKLNKRLAVALDKAEVANKAKSVFLKNMTHEINTPINQIYGFAQIMSDRSMPLDEDTIRNMCDAINDSSRHLTELAENIVEVADKVSDLDGLETIESVLKH